MSALADSHRPVEDTPTGTVPPERAGIEKPSASCAKSTVISKAMRTEQTERGGERTRRAQLPP